MARCFKDDLKKRHKIQSNEAKFQKQKTQVQRIENCREQKCLMTCGKKVSVLILVAHEVAFYFADSLNKLQAAMNLQGVTANRRNPSECENKLGTEGAHFHKFHIAYNYKWSRKHVPNICSRNAYIDRLLQNQAC